MGNSQQQILRATVVRMASKSIFSACMIVSVKAAFHPKCALAHIDAAPNEMPTPQTAEI